MCCKSIFFPRHHTIWYKVASLFIFDFFFSLSVSSFLFVWALFDVFLVSPLFILFFQFERVKLFICMSPLWCFLVSLLFILFRFSVWACSALPAVRAPSDVFSVAGVHCTGWLDSWRQTVGHVTVTPLSPISVTFRTVPVKIKKRLFFYPHL